MYETLNFDKDYKNCRVRKDFNDQCQFHDWSCPYVNEERESIRKTNPYILWIREWFLSTQSSKGCVKWQTLWKCILSYSKVFPSKSIFSLWATVKRYPTIFSDGVWNSIASIRSHPVANEISSGHWEMINTSLSVWINYLYSSSLFSKKWQTISDKKVNRQSNDVALDTQTRLKRESQ